MKLRHDRPGVALAGGASIDIGLSPEVIGLDRYFTDFRGQS
jgi:hypothetical protein